MPFQQQLHRLQRHRLSQDFRLSQFLPQQLLDGQAGQRRGDGQRQDTHGKSLLEKFLKKSIAQEGKI